MKLEEREKEQKLLQVFLKIPTIKMEKKEKNHQKVKKERQEKDPQREKMEKKEKDH
jgi:hypothetical protein